MARVFLIDPGNPEFPLLVSRVLRHPDGSIKSADVENGGWTLKVVDGVAGAYDGDWGGGPVAQWPALKWEEVPVPKSVGGHYNDAFAWLEGSSTGSHEVAPEDLLTTEPDDQEEPCDEGSDLAEFLEREPVAWKLADQQPHCAYMPEPKDLTIQAWSSKPTTQLIPRLERGVKITHIPSGMAVTCDTERSPHANRALAMQELGRRLANLNPAPDVAQPVAVPEIIEAVADFVGSQKGGPFAPAVIKAAIIGQLEYGDAFTKLLTPPDPPQIQQSAGSLRRDVLALVGALEAVMEFGCDPRSNRGQWALEKAESALAPYRKATSELENTKRKQP